MDVKANETISKAVLVTVVIKRSGDDWETSLSELERLADTAGASVFAKVIQEKEAPDARTYIGKGKLAELKTLCTENAVDTVIFDSELSPSQIKNIEDELSGKENSVNVIDRSMLILDIFAAHAKTSEGKLQTELAQLKYTVPRLTGHGTELSRLGGGIGTRGPGESKLETDKRHIKRRIMALEEALAELAKNRAVQRAHRDRTGMFKVAIAGYTNAGKSTLTNALTGAGILAEDKLFATLDPTTRKYKFESGEEILITDTVGLIRNLPHHLIEAFKSTLDEMRSSDAIAVVIDASDSEAEAQKEITVNLAGELGAGDKPMLFVYNKCDLIELPDDAEASGDRIFVSAKTGYGLGKLASELERLSSSRRKEVTLVFGAEGHGILSKLYREETVLEVSYGEGETTVRAQLSDKALGALKKYIRNS